MRTFLKIILALLVIVALVLILYIVAVAKGYTLIGFIKSWFAAANIKPITSIIGGV